MQRIFAKHFGFPEANASPLVDSAREKLPKTFAWLGDVQKTLELEKNELESLRSAYWSTVSEIQSCIPPISSIRTGARAVIQKSPSSTSNSSTSSPG